MSSLSDVSGQLGVIGLLLIIVVYFFASLAFFFNRAE
jgi:hypothetical protein